MRSPSEHSVAILAGLFFVVGAAAPSPDYSIQAIRLADSPGDKASEMVMASATFSDADRPANLRTQQRMIELAGSIDRVIPGHDALQFKKFPTQGRIARIK